jgi:hypothetical protein
MTLNEDERPESVPPGITGSAYSVWWPLVVLLALTLVTQLASVAYTSTQKFSAVILPSTIALLAVTAPLATAGLWLGARIGLGAPLLTALLSRNTGAGRRLAQTIVPAIGIGLVAGLFLWLLRILSLPFLPPELPELGHRGVIGGLLVSVSAALAEEVWLRLGAITIIAWSISRVQGHSELRPQVAWVAIVLAAFAFGAIHIPQLAAAGAATAIGVAATMLGNTLVGIVCGWLFWQRGLIAAVFAHLSIDIVLHVLPALLG